MPGSDNPPNTVRARCPECRQKVRLKADKIEREITCPRCRNTVRFNPIPTEPSAQDNPADAETPQEGAPVVNGSDVCANQAEEPKPKAPSCSACGGDMKKARKDKSGCGCFLFLVGGILCLTGIGLIIGIPIILVAMYFLVTPKGVWRCRECGSEIPRHVSWAGLFEVN